MAVACDDLSLTLFDAEVGRATMSPQHLACRMLFRRGASYNIRPLNAWTFRNVGPYKGIVALGILAHLAYYVSEFDRVSGFFFVCECKFIS